MRGVSRTRPAVAPIGRLAPMAMKMRQSLAQLEQEFRHETQLDRSRRETLRRQAVRRSRMRTHVRRRKRSSVRYWVLIFSLIATALIVTAAMFETLYYLLGRRRRAVLRCCRRRQKPELVSARLAGSSEPGHRAGTDDYAPAGPSPRVRRAASTSSRAPLWAVAALLLNLDVDLLAEHRDVTRGLDSDPYLLTHDRQYRHLDVVADHDALVGLAGEYQHSRLPAIGR